MIRDKFIDVAIALGVDTPLRRLRAALYPAYQHDRLENQRLNKLLRTLLKEDSNCIDIGAYRGRTLSDIMLLAPRGKHIAYEPLPHLCRYLVRRFPSVDVRQAAVSNSEGEANYIYVKGAPAESGFREKAYSRRSPLEKITVRTEVLDKCLPTDYEPALIKIDVEGAERQVIEGAIETIRRYKPIVLFEHGKGSAAYYGTQPSHIYNLLSKQAGLRIFDLDNHGPYTLVEFEASYASDERWDYIALP
jgi:FkbM family methyltransferase